MKHILKLKAVIWITLTLMLAGCLKQELQTGLSEQEAQEIIVLLKEHGLEATRERDAHGDDKGPPMFSVSIKGGDQNLVLAWRILQENGLPRQKAMGLEEVFSKTGLIPTASEEKARMVMALQGEISRTLKSVMGVADARVQVVLPENSPILDKADWKTTTASVLLKYNWPQPPLREDEVRSLVAKGIEGLSPENVAVVFNKIEPRQPPAKNVAWYLGNQQFLLVSLVLLSASALGNLALTVRGFSQRRQIERLQKDARKLPAAPQLAVESATRK